MNATQEARFIGVPTFELLDRQLRDAIDLRGFVFWDLFQLSPARS